MMYHNIVYKSNSSSFDDILQHLTAVDKDYATELSIRTDINAYAHKLFEKADRIEAWENDVLIGLAAYYNNETDHTIYISNISVAKAFRSCGIASTLLNRIKEIIDLKQFAKITLEADESLVNFYKKNDFAIGKQLTNRSYEMEYYRRTGI